MVTYINYDSIGVSLKKINKLKKKTSQLWVYHLKKVKKLLKNYPHFVGVPGPRGQRRSGSESLAGRTGRPATDLGALVAFHEMCKIDMVHISYIYIYLTYIYI